MAMMQTDLQRVVEAFAGDAMFTKGLPFAVEVAPAERHRYQAELVDMAREHLQATLQNAKQLQSDVAAKLESDGMELSSRQSLAAEKLSVAEEFEKANEAKQEALSKAQGETKTATEKHKQAEASKAAVEGVKNEQMQLRDRAMSVADGALSLLRTGGWDDDADLREDSVQAVHSLLKDSDSDEVLLAAMPAVFALKPSARRPFDTVVEEAIAKDIAGQIAKHSAAQAGAEDDVMEADAEALGLWAILSEEKEATAAAEVELASARAAVRDAVAARKEADTAVAKAQADVQATMTQQVQLESNIAEREAAIAAFERLAAGAVAVEEVPAPTATIDAAMDTAPDAADAAPMEVDCVTSGIETAPMVACA